ncbi:S1C family serine protease [Desulforamulus aquiferis]|uniref:Trypsin-like peptidase domain-containing protein n=1 Tax=Desulforamulus aquiferis TaxID=1397668 RepID=A0AAW7ZE19_9FIRM|nr:trypsin-like peptidase domain-containing protein [Desulforamulus aquiferis]MDO7787035.1 trypsin-like peptidase domain-containing protein [Desulforamulus aquiferis]
MMQWRKAIVIFLLLAFVSGIMFAGGCMLVRDLAPKQGSQNQEGLADASLPGVGPDIIANIVEQTGPAVVKINTLVEVDSKNNPLLNDPFFRQFFGVPSQPQYQGGVGSGFLISKDGYILTNSHVVSGAKEISVLLKEQNKAYAARLVGTDPSLDLAVLKIEGNNFPTLTLGDSNKIRVGNWVIAIGSPFGLENTVTIGVISAKERPIEIDSRTFEHLLQTDASINPGNSGGPLLNLNGEVIGINTAINSQAQGIGFAIPTSTVKEVLNELIEKGSVSRPWLGVQIHPVTADIANFLGYNSTEGAVIRAVVQDGPAQRAGLKEGDIITAIDGEKISNPEELISTIQKKKVGVQVEADVFRNGKTIKVKIQTMERPAEAS